MKLAPIFKSISFWTMSLLVATALALTACSQPKTEKAPRKNNRLAPGTTATTTQSPAGTPITTVGINAQVSVTLNKPVLYLTGLASGGLSPNTIVTAGNFSASGANAGLQIVSYHFGADYFSQNLPSFSSSWVGAYASACSSQNCEIYYLALYLNNGSTYQTVGLRYDTTTNEEPRVITYLPGQTFEPDYIFTDLESGHE